MAKANSAKQCGWHGCPKPLGHINDPEDEWHIAPGALEALRTGDVEAQARYLLGLSEGEREGRYNCPHPSVDSMIVRLEALTAAAPADLANHPLVQSAYEAAMKPDQPEMTLEELKTAPATTERVCDLAHLTHASCIPPTKSCAEHYGKFQPAEKGE